MKRLKIYNIIYPLISIVAILVLWIIESDKINTELILPTPFQTLKAMCDEFSSREFWVSLSNSAVKVVISYLISLVSAIIIGSFAFLFKPLWSITYPIVTVLRVVPTMSIILLAIIWFDESKAPMFISMLVILPLMYTSVYSAINNHDKKLMEMSKVYKVNKKDMIFRMFIPTVFNNLFDDLLSILSLSVKLIISAEAIAQTKNSLGKLMYVSKNNLEVATLFAYTLSAILLSILLESAIRLLRRLLRKLKVC